MQDKITIIEATMDANEARECVQRINSSAAEMGRLLLDLKKRGGWRSLGYESWTSCLENEFEYSRKYLYEIMRAAPILESMSAKGYKLNTKQADLLQKYPESIRPAILELAAARYDNNITQSNLKRVAEVLNQAVQTGHVSVGDGSESIGLDAALQLEDQEARKRQWEYMNQGVTHISFKTISELASRLLKTLDAVHIEELLKLLNAT